MTIGPILTKLVLSMVVSVTVASIYVFRKGTPELGQLDADPVSILTDQVTEVTFSLPVSVNRDFGQAYVWLDRVGLPLGSHNPRQDVDFFRMYDDGTHGDKRASDRVFSRRIPIAVVSQGVTSFQARAGFAKYSGRIQSEVIALEVQ